MTREKDVSSSTSKKVKNVKWIRFFLSLIVIFSLGYIVFNYVPFIAKYNHYVIVTGSMQPKINIGDVVIIDTGKDVNEIFEQDIIAFYVDINDDGTDEVIVHYVYSVTGEGDDKVFRTYSEMDDDPDEWILSKDDIIGIHVLTIPKIGPFILFAQSTIGRIVLAIDIVVIYLLVEFFFKKKEIGKDIKDINKE